MKLVVGLGNPGRKYEGTRHNAGFWLVERFAAETHTVLRKDPKFQALVGRHEPSGAWLLLPQSYMNSSGRPIQMLASFFKIPPAEILVAHDELDFAPGVSRIKQGGGIAGHNGLKDISARLGSHDYWRLRIGIGHPGEQQGVTDFVLHKPTQEERAAIDAAIGRALEVLPLALAGDLQGAMLKLHTQEAAEQAERPKAPDKAGKPGKPGKAKKAAAPKKVEKPEKPEKESSFSALLRKFLPGTGSARKK
ncbi:MAG: aminoacyl-tRNA hydrolase [Betaproteobacteria bacterium]|nr:aminoacyl-tRNA hydrolase [Betaproteobacteria bacterium]